MAPVLTVVEYEQVFYHQHPAQPTVGQESPDSTRLDRRRNLSAVDAAPSGWPSFVVGAQSALDHRVG